MNNQNQNNQKQNGAQFANVEENQSTGALLKKRNYQKIGGDTCLPPAEAESLKNQNQGEPTNRRRDTKYINKIMDQEPLFSAKEAQNC